MTKVVISDYYFCLTSEVFQYMYEHGFPFSEWHINIFKLRSKDFNPSFHMSSNELRRDDPLLVEAVETVVHAAEYHKPKYRVIEVPDNVHWHIESRYKGDDDDGSEKIVEDHQEWE